MSQLKIGIVGFPNVGKSTLFNALLKRQVALAANYPFATIEPNVGIAEVPDARLSALAKIVGTTVIKPATVEFVDIAGLVKGASKGEGLGNKFLSHIRETSVVCHVLRDFSDGDVIREGAQNPKEDLVNIRTELQLSDIATLEKQTAPRGVQDKAILERWETIEMFAKILDEGKGVFESLEKESTSDLAKELCLLTAKKEIFVINVDEDKLVKSGEDLSQTYADQLGVDSEKVVVVSAKIESELSSLSSEDQAAYMKELGLLQSGLERLAKVAYKVLGLQSFLTAGEKEVRAWAVPQGSTAPEAAGVIHSDFAKHFIKAKVAGYQDFIKHSGWKGVKEAGKLGLEGKGYIMQEGDVVEFMVGQ